MPDSLFIPISELNQIRREVLSQAQDLLLNHYTPTKKSVKATRKKLNKFYEDYESFNNLSKKKNPKITKEIPHQIVVLFIREDNGTPLLIKTTTE